MKPINICVPTLKRYDLLGDMLHSLDRGTVKPTRAYIIDNGCHLEKVMAAVDGISYECVMMSGAPMGLATAWNRFIREVGEERVICNDDLLFRPDSLEKLVSVEGDFVSAMPGTNAFSCYVLRNACIAKVGEFDEMISPGYAYFEDCDYVERMIMQRIPITSGLMADVIHVGTGSNTTAVNTSTEWMEHHQKFVIARENFRAKWGRLPDVPGEHWPKVEATA